MTALQHLDLSNCSNFNARSVAGLLQLRGLTTLDVRGTGAGDLAGLSQLAQLSSCRRLALSLLPAEQQQQHGHEITGIVSAAAQQHGSSGGSAAAAAGCSSVEPDQAGTSSCTSTSGGSELRQLVHQFGHSWISRSQQQQQVTQHATAASSAAAAAVAMPLEQHHAHRLVYHYEQQQQQQQEHCPAQQTPLQQPRRCSSIDGRSSATMSSSLEDYAYLAVLGKCHSLRQLVLGAGPAVAEYCRQLLPPWVEVR
jgi:hypothetical protein